MGSLIQGTAPINAKGEESYGQFTKHQVNLSPTKERELKKKKKEDFWYEATLKAIVD